MEKYELQKLRDLPIEGVAERLGLRVTRHKALCPFHDDRHPSLSFRVSKNTYRCFVCGASGGTIDGLQTKTTSSWKSGSHNSPPLGEDGRGLLLTPVAMSASSSALG